LAERLFDRLEPACLIVEIAEITILEGDEPNSVAHLDADV
jgi:hypothetical protein